jgi:hypothetical protein
MASAGGPAVSSGGAGGAGGLRGVAPGPGLGGNTSGGGGGSLGSFRIWVPAGVAPDTATATTSPAIPAPETIATH